MMRGGMLMWRRGFYEGKVVMGILLVMLLINVTNGNQEEEGQRLPRPSVVRGEILTTTKSISSLRELESYCIMSLRCLVQSYKSKSN